MHSRFFWKLFSGYVLLVVIAVAVVGILVARRITRDMIADTERDLRVRARLVEPIALPFLGGGDPAELQRQVRVLGTDIATRITIVREDGTVIADSEEDPRSMDNHGTRPEIVAARETGTGMSTRFSRTVAANLMYFAVAVNQSGERLGFVRTSLPLTAIQDRIGGVRRLVAFVGIGAAVLALVLGLVVARRVTGPLASMTAAAESIAGGKYDHRVPATSQDEIGQLGSAFNRMANELQGRLATITEDRSKLLTILGGMTEGVLAVDGKQHIVHLNAAAGRILGVPPSESLGKPIWEVTRIRQVNEALERVLHVDGDVNEELHLDIDGRDRVVQLHGAPLADGQGGLLGAVIVLHEVTELRRLETVRQEFVANVSHELKTPITAIRGLIDTIVDDPDMPEDTQDRFQRKIQSQSVRLASLVTDLLTLARLDAAEGLLQSEPVDLRDVVRATVDHFRADAEERQVNLTAEIHSEPVVVLGDIEALGLLTNNLVDNALKYTPRGGTVTVKLLADDAARLEVRDTGIGIGAEHLDRIFERFYRVDKARSRELGGTGLGLSIVKHISTTHGGSVSAESRVGVGSTFRVRLPLLDQGG